MMYPVYVKYLTNFDIPYENEIPIRTLSDNDVLC